ncbi:hypothetical protein HPB49_026401 [Dermacentor silvarum]|nr:hypothetical protein HPB49_026401 [Dermacentor silvarum]
MAAQSQFSVSQESVRYWRVQKRKLLKCNPCKMPFHARSAVHPQLEDALADFVRELRFRSLSVSVYKMCCEAVELAQEAGLEGACDKRPSFEDSPGTSDE